MKRILIVEDDPAILMGLERSLADEHFEVLTATDGGQGYLMARRENIDLIILDLLLPKKNGLEICRDLRKDGVTTPILMLTSKKEEVDEVMGFEVGADDYVAKPFSLPRLLARIRHLLQARGEVEKDIDVYAFANIVIDFKKLEAQKEGKPLALSAREFDILKYFVLHEGEAVSRDDLLNHVWGYDSFPTTRTVDNYILSLRKQIEDVPSEPQHLLTLPTVGYRFVKER